MKYLNIDKDGKPTTGNDTPQLFAVQPSGNLVNCELNRNAEIRVLYRFPNNKVDIAYCMYPLGYPGFDVRASNLGKLIDQGNGWVAVQDPV